MPDEDLQNFTNPTGYWEHKGAFTVELAKGAQLNHVPDTVSFNGNIAIIRHGRIKQSMGAIQMYSYEQPFYWNYDHIRIIRDGNGHPLWVNYNYRTMI